MSSTFNDLVSSKIDLWGPYWICTFLIFLLSVTGHFWEILGSLLININRAQTYNFENIGLAVTLVYGALILFPSIFVAVNKGLGIDMSPMLGICIYGYSFTAYLLAALLCVIPDKGFRWLTMFAACGHSCCFLLTNFKTSIEKQQEDYKIAVKG